MTVNKTADQDFEQIISSLQASVKRLQLAVTNPEGLASPNFDDIFFPDEDGDGYFNPLEPLPAPTNVVVDTGAFYDTTFFDVSWDAVPNARNGYLVRLMKKNGPGDYDLSMENQARGTSLRVEPVEPLTTYGIQVAGVTALGRVGTFSDIQDVMSGADLTLPPAPTGVVVARGATTVVVKYTPLTAEQARDVANGAGIYEVQIDTVLSFDSGNLRIQRGADQIIAFNDIITEANWYARVRAIDSSGNAGTWSATAGPALAGGVIDSMIVAGLDAAKITVGFLSASRLDAGTVTADKLGAGTFTAGSITLSGSGQFWAGTWPDGIALNSTGIRLYKNGGVTVSLDAVSGDAAFAGSISSSTISTSTFSWPNGTISSAGIKIIYPGDTGSWSYSNVYGVSWCSPTTIRWVQWASSPWDLWLERRGDQSGTRFIISCTETIIEADNNTLGSTGQFYSYGGGSQGLNINGTLQATTKYFLIDHPLDPENLFLRHAVVEGPEHAVFYRGVAQLDGQGKATVELPDYFDALTREGSATVELTPVLGSKKSSEARVTPACSLPSSGRFDVEGEPDSKVCWLVMAERADIDELQPTIDKFELAGAVEYLMEAGREADARRILEHPDSRHQPQDEDDEQRTSIVDRQRRAYLPGGEKHNKRKKA